MAMLTLEPFRRAAVANQCVDWPSERDHDRSPVDAVGTPEKSGLRQRAQRDIQCRLRLRNAMTAYMQGGLSQREQRRLARRTVLVGIGQVIEQLPEKLRVAILALTSRGWFFDPEMPLSRYWKAEQLVSSGDAAGADRLMVQHFEGRLDAIELRLCERLPRRAGKFRNAFAAHRRSEYDLSILAFLSQADGISKELRGGHFFLRDRKTARPQTASYAESSSENVFDQIVHLALVEELPIKQQMSKIACVAQPTLNRHAAMHGESLDYDTKENSLRALSLLNYVALGFDDGPPAAARAPVDMLLHSAATSLPAKIPVRRR